MGWDWLVRRSLSLRLVQHKNSTLKRHNASTPNSHYKGRHALDLEETLLNSVRSDYSITSSAHSNPEQPIMSSAAAHLLRLPGPTPYWNHGEVERQNQTKAFYSQSPSEQLLYCLELKEAERGASPERPQCSRGRNVAPFLCGVF